MRSIYAGPGDAAQKRAAKAAAVAALDTRYRRMRKGRWGGYGGYDGWFESPVNNARLAATAIYSDRVEAFLRLFDLCGRDYPRFYGLVAKIGELDAGAREKALATTASCSSRSDG